MPQKKLRPGIRLNHLSIENYKKLDKLAIEFPHPLMPKDTDILVFGSENGGGKTSVLECCSLLMLAGAIGEKVFELSSHEIESSRDITDLLVKPGCQQAFIKGDFEQNDKNTFSISLAIQRGKPIQSAIRGDRSLIKRIFAYSRRGSFFSSNPDYAMGSLFSFSGEPLIMPPLLHFNSYRKVQESNPELGMMADDYPEHRVGRPGMRYLYSPVSSFKLEIVRSLMGKAGLFEGLNKDESVLEKLNDLIERYCGGHIEKLLPLPDSKVDIRIKPKGEKDSFSFDGLSSGQKEMISTLFLIWKHTQDQPGIVLIDEPELHLNAQWHSDFVEQLRKLAPRNQYILATHSEKILGSVESTYRTLLEPDGNEAE